MVSNLPASIKRTELTNALILKTTDEDVADGQRISAAVREMGSTEIYAQLLQHSPNGR